MSFSSSGECWMFNVKNKQTKKKKKQNEKTNQNNIIWIDEL